MEDAILAAIKMSAPAFVEIARDESPFSDADALTVASTMALLFCAIHVINLSGKRSSLKTVIDHLVVRIPETLPQVPVNLRKAILDDDILADVVGGLDGSTVVDTLTAVNTLYKARAEKDVGMMWDMKDGPMGPLGGAIVVIGDTLLGKGNTSQTAAFSIAVLAFYRELTETMKIDSVQSPSHPISENAHYEQALEELESGTKDRGVWAKAYAESTDDDGAKRLYIRLRVAQLSRVDKRLKVQAQPPQQSVRAAVHSSKPASQNTTSMSASSDGLATRTGHVRMSQNTTSMSASSDGLATRTGHVRMSQNTTPMSASSDASAKPADEAKPNKRGMLYRLAQGISIAMPLHFIGGMLFYGTKKYQTFDAWDHISGQMWLGYLILPFALVYWLNLAIEDAKPNSRL
jgi:hypothetical protein